ncbi:extracellular globin-E1-like isoform X2 [Lineus longissimus]
MAATVNEDTGLNQRQAQVIKDSWQNHIKHDLKKYGIIFYQRFFMTYPDYQQLFQFMRERPLDQLIRNKDRVLVTQSLKTMNAIGQLVAALDAPDKMKDLAFDIGKAHYKYGCRKEHFDRVGPILLDTMSVGLGRDMDEYCHQAWKAWIEALIPIMNKGNGSAV